MLEGNREGTLEGESLLLEGDVAEVDTWDFFS
jgi:hypothetical protein